MKSLHDVDIKSEQMLPVVLLWMNLDMILVPIEPGSVGPLLAASFKGPA
jgi:hypothetical protein